MGLGDFWATVIALFVVFCLVYFPIIRPIIKMHKQKKEHREQIERDKRKIELLEQLASDNEDKNN